MTEKVDPGAGYRLLFLGDKIPEVYEYWDYEKWVIPKTYEHTGKQWYPWFFCPIRVPIKPFDNSGVEVTNSGPYVAIEVHRAALAEVERLKAELDKRCEIWRIARDIAANERDAAEQEVKRLKAELEAVKQPQPSGKPQPGEWWLNDNGERVRIVGWSSHGRLYFEYECGTVLNRKPAHTNDWKHLQNCTGWDWQPDTEPEWFDLTPFSEHVWRGCDEAFHPSDNKWHCSMMASAVEACVRELKQVGYTQFRCLLKDAPPELVAKTSKPAEDPDEWVTQDRVSERQGVDEYRFVDQCNNAKSEWKPCIVSTSTKHGMSLPKGFIELRCRRRDLPPMPEKPKTETLVFHEVIVCRDGTRKLEWIECPSEVCVGTGRTSTWEVVR